MLFRSCFAVMQNHAACVILKKNQRRRSMKVQDNYYSRYTTLTGQQNQILIYQVREPLGTGTITHCTLGPGVEMAFMDYLTNQEHDIEVSGSDNMIEFFYCLEGNVVMQFDHESTLLKGGMLGIYDFNHPPQSYQFRESRFKGISLMLSADCADSLISTYLGTQVATVRDMLTVLKKNRKMFQITCAAEMSEVFLSIANTPLQYNLDYLKLKAMELILFGSEGLRKSNAAGNKAMKPAETRAVWRIESYLHTHLAEELTLDRIAAGSDCLPGQVKRLIKKYHNTSVYRYLKELRLLHAKNMLLESEDTVTDIAIECGWLNISKFSAAFKTRFGCSPSEYRSKRLS